MKSANDRRSVWDLRALLLSSLDFAEEFAVQRPEFADAVNHFSQEVRRIKKELMASFKDDLVQAPLHDVVHGLTCASAMASILAEQRPEKSDALNVFEEGLKQAREKFIRTVRPEWYREGGHSEE
jgi:hypothetical protein